MEKILLEISLGEALDKLSILEIKIAKINDERNAECKKEYETIYEKLSKYIERFPYHYRILKEINTVLWDLEDTFNNSEVFKNIKIQNGRRFRMKSKINNLANSNLKEQKSYKKSKAYVYTHLGLGDHFWMNGSIRLLATCYDEVMVVCKKNNEAVVRAMYVDDSCITFHIIDDDSQLFPFSIKKYHLIDQGFDVYSCGYHTDDPKIYDFPLSFYDDMKMPRSVRTSYFYVPSFTEARELYNKIPMPYILIHQNSSQKKIDLYTGLQKANPTTLILDINQDNYEVNHKYHNIAGLVVNQPMLFYKDLIENAKEIHCIESSFYCFCSHLDLSKVEKKVCYFPCDLSSERLGIFETGILDG